MSKTLKKMQDQHGNSKYPWYKWLSGKPYKVKRGRDFDVSKAQFQNLLHVTAKRKGYSLKSMSRGDWITFQFTKIDKGEQSEFEKVANS